MNGLVSVINFRKWLAIFASIIYSAIVFLLFLVLKIFIYYTFCNFPTVLKCSVLFLSFFFCLHFSLECFYCPVFRITDSSILLSSLMSPLKVIFISAVVFLFSNIFHWFLPFPYFFLYYPSILSYCQLFPLETLVY